MGGFLGWDTCPKYEPAVKGSYEYVYGKPEWGVKFEDGTPTWDYFNNAWYLRRYPKKDIPFLTFSNGKNDTAIGWKQAVEFYRALHATQQPHMFGWGQEGHGQRAQMPRGGGERVMPSISGPIRACLPSQTVASRITRALEMRETVTPRAKLMAISIGKLTL